MAQLKTYVCDGCGAHRRDASPWYTLDTTTKTAVIAKWDEQLAESVEYHLCGVGCLQRMLSAVITEWSGSEQEKACSIK